MVSLEGHIICEGIQPTFLTGLAALFSTFYNFILQYQEEAACTLEFIQRLDTFSKTCIFIIFSMTCYCTSIHLQPFIVLLIQVSYTTWFLHSVWRNTIIFQVLRWNKPWERHQGWTRKSRIKENWQSHQQKDNNSQSTCIHSAEETHGLWVGLHLKWWDYSIPSLAYIYQNTSLSHSSNSFSLSISPPFSLPLSPLQSRKS